MKLDNFIKIEDKTKLVQEFQEICKYFCSKKDNSLKNFILERKWKEIFIFNKFKININDNVFIKCQDCGWKSKFPSIFAKKLFKDGVHSNLLFKFAKDKIISSWFLNFYAGLWRVWLIVLGFLILGTFALFNIQNVVIGSSTQVSFNDLYSNKMVGKYIKTSGIADYSYAFVRDIYIDGDQRKIIDKEVYFPLFLSNNSKEFIIVRGDYSDAEDILSKGNVLNLDAVRIQKYTGIGKIESINTIKSSNLKKFFTEELVQKKGLNVPQIVLNTSTITQFTVFKNRLIKPYLFILFLLITSVIVQIYIDKIIFLKTQKS